MNPSEKSLSQILQIEGARDLYFVPKYQRAYAWRRENWDDLLKDLEDDPEHFMGSVICVPRIPTEMAPGDFISFELIDGQQRLTTISLLLCAFHKKLTDLRPAPGDENAYDRWRELTSSVYKKLIAEKVGSVRPHESPVERSDRKAYFARLLPSSQSQNREDFVAALRACRALPDAALPSNWGNRRVAKCYNHFLRTIPNSVNELESLLDRVNNLLFIHISVPTQADAYRLFEALNNRGQPLSALDIIKNGVLAEIEGKQPGSIDAAFELWRSTVERLSDDETIQERYLRHFYHAFRHTSELKVANYPRATKATLIRIYGVLTEREPSLLLKLLYEKSYYYQQLVYPGTTNDPARRALLSDLNRIGAAPSHQLLLFLLDCEASHRLEDGAFNKIVHFLCKYFVRRNVTDRPGTNRLDAIFGGLIEACLDEIATAKCLSANWVIRQLRENKSDPPSDDIAFRADLEDNLWDYDPRMARYILCRLNESYSTREYDPNLWKQDERGRFVWTVEHVLPQADRLRKEWVEMIAGGDATQAREVQERWVHCLGNLTLSAYNSRLSDMPFPDKQKRQEVSADGAKLMIGYKNHLPINDLEFSVGNQNISLASAPSWSAEEIRSRNDAIITRCLELFQL